MNFINFKNKIIRQPFFRSADLEPFEPNLQVFRNRLLRWEKQGLVQKLRKGVYILNATDRKIDPSPQFIANQLHSPSYVSLAYAMNMYGIIPERVIEVTSVTTKKTLRFKTPLGNFAYQHIKADCFRGFKSVKDENGLSCFIAEPEKAVVDFIYLNLGRFKGAGSGIFEESYRFQNIEQLSCEKIRLYTRMFHNRNLNKACNALCVFIKKEKNDD